MEIEWLEMLPDATVARAVERGAARVGETGTRFLVGTSFERVVAELTGRPYNAERTGGEVGARTLRGSDGNPIILIGPVTLGEGEAVIERTVVHESGHAMMLRRGEDLDQIALRDLPLATSFILQLADIAIGEFRAELFVRDLGYPDLSRHEDRLVGFSIDPVRIASAPETAAPRVYAQMMAPVLQEYTITLANAAAWDQRPGPESLEHLFDGGSWSTLIDYLRAIPTASEPVGAELHTELVRKMHPLIDEALLDFGFEWVTEPNGSSSFYRIVSDELLEARFRGASEWLSAHTGPEA